MPKPKKISRILDKAESRLAALKAVSTSLDLGNGLTVESYEQLIQETRQKLETYNTVLATANDASIAAEEAETELSELSERMLIGVASKFGKNSNEYATAGGTRRKDRKRPTRRTAKSVDESASVA
ncbi:hypothetical protein K9N68_16755 [Kovacikia minuta CCNUW1]|uniref:hypothetical protein n=1 Tax=Kovacikia minuta TaxID=2931930 RepID=UPI001CCB6045|nr:hypothetical protein [Kovacikia minuta]UBF29335.1 hypothetical protein K9N68_16755 [Kovacikia minuta CCNUW1]